MSSGISVKGVISQKAAHTEGIRSHHPGNRLAGLVFCHPAGAHTFIKTNISVLHGCQKDCSCQDRTAENGNSMPRKAFRALLLHAPAIELPCRPHNGRRCRRKHQFQDQASARVQKSTDHGIHGHKEQYQRHPACGQPVHGREHHRRDIGGQHAECPAPPVGRICETVERRPRSGEQHHERHACKRDLQIRMRAQRAFAGKEQQHAQQADPAHSHAGPVGQHKACPESDKGFQETFIIFRRIQQAVGHAFRSPRILHKTQQDRQHKYRACRRPQDRADQEPARQEENLLKGLAYPAYAPAGLLSFTAALSMFCRYFFQQKRKEADPERPPHDVEHCHGNQHIEEIEVADTGQEDRRRKQPAFSAPENMLRADEQQRKPDHCVQKIGMPHAEKDEAAEYIHQCPAQIRRRVPVPHLAAVAVKKDSRKIHAEGDHCIVEKEHMLLRHEYSRQTEGISDHIVLQCREQIRPVSHVHVESRKRGMSLQNALQDRPSPPGIIAECHIVL